MFVLPETLRQGRQWQIAYLCYFVLGGGFLGWDERAGGTWTTGGPVKAYVTALQRQEPWDCAMIENSKGS